MTDPPGWFSGLLANFICRSISSKKNLVIKLNEDFTKYNIAVTLPKIVDLIDLPKIAVAVELTCDCLVVKKCVF